MSADFSWQFATDNYRLPEQIRDSVSRLNLSRPLRAVPCLLVAVLVAELSAVEQCYLLEYGDGLLRPALGLQPARALGKVKVEQKKRRPDEGGEQSERAPLAAKVGRASVQNDATGEEALDHVAHDASPRRTFNGGGERALEKGS
jgi:hypothetical protein